MKKLRALVTRHERVGPAWLNCPVCGCAYPPSAWCPYREFHDGWSDPRVLFPNDHAPREATDGGG